MTTNRKRITKSNRAAWNEVMPLHQKASKDKWDKTFQQPGYHCFIDAELKLLKKLGIIDKAIAHLCCNNGVELLSLKNLGAGICTGFDISDEAIREAQERAEKSQIDCQFFQTDVYDIGQDFENQFDLVYISSGTLGWIPELKLFFGKAAAILRDNGHLFIHEIHPFSEMLPFDDSKGDDFLRIVEPYFKSEPYIERGGLDYVGGEQYTSNIPHYWFVHTMSDILMGLTDNQFTITQISEYGTDISAGHRRIEEAKAGIPLSYILIGQKLEAEGDYRMGEESRGSPDG